MTWFKVSDDLHNHEKWEVLEERDDVTRFANAVMLWTFAGSYCGQHRNGGIVTFLRVTKLLPLDRDASRDAADDLVLAGFWDVDGDTYSFRNWAEYQPAAEAEDKQKASAAARSKRYREKKKGRDASHRDVTRDDGTLPDPTRPDPTKLTPPNPPGGEDLWSGRFDPSRAGEVLAEVWEPWGKGHPTPSFSLQTRLAQKLHGWAQGCSLAERQARWVRLHAGLVGEFKPTNKVSAILSGDLNELTSTPSETNDRAQASLEAKQRQWLREMGGEVKL